MASDKGSCEKAGPLTAAGVARLADAEVAGLAGEDGWFMPDYPGSGPKRGARRDSTPVNGGVGGDGLAAVARHFAQALRILQRLHADLRRLRLHRSEDGGKRHVGGVAPGAESHEAHGDGRARRVEDVPAPAQEDLDVGVEVGGAQRRVGAEGDAGGKALRVG